MTKQQLIVIYCNVLYNPFPAPNINLLKQEILNTKIARLLREFHHRLLFPKLQRYYSKIIIFFTQVIELSLNSTISFCIVRLVQNVILKMCQTHTESNSKIVLFFSSNILFKYVKCFFSVCTYF